MRKTSTAAPRCWDVVPGVPMERLLTWCLDIRGADRVLVAAPVDRDSDDLTLLKPAVERRVYGLIGDRLLSAAYCSAWPGTALAGHVGLVWTATFDRTLMRRMVRAQGALSGWKVSANPPLPEDICLYRDGDRFPILVSVSREGDGWLFHRGRIEEDLAVLADCPLPADLIPPPPFIVRGRMSVIERSRRKPGGRQGS